MKSVPILTLLALPLLLAQAAVQGSEKAGDKPSGAPAQAHSHRGADKLMIENGEGASITLWKPDLTTQPLTLAHGGVPIPRTGMDNYHAVIAEKNWGDSRETSIRYLYRFDRPSKHSPAELAGAVKTEFEIVPDPIPREHNRYRSDQTWGFLLRLHGAPAGGLPVTLTTDNGSRLEAVSDPSGRVAFHLPDDFPHIVPGERDSRSAGFSISAETQSAGTLYQTTLSADYSVNPAHWQSTRLGLLVAGIGFVAGGLLGRKKPSGSQQR